jgi:hypothetical protein
MAYDVVRSEVVLYDGYTTDTWTWDGTTWTQEHPSHRPSLRWFMSMTYDAARGRVVLFGGVDEGALGDTWTWDGTDWTRHHPTRSPSDRYFAAMTWDAALNEVLLFGGGNEGTYLRDTWSWDGRNWTRLKPARSPPSRCCAAISVDAMGKVVLFGGFTYDSGEFADTWTWDGSTWRIPFTAHLHSHPDSGPPGMDVRVIGTGFAGHESVTVSFVDSMSGKTLLGTFATSGNGTLKADVMIPPAASLGPQKITAVGALSAQKGRTTFTVT